MPKTLQLEAASPADIDRAAGILRGGGTVAFPTETVYGLGANALDEAAVARIFEAKQRPSWDPLIVHIADKSGMEQIAELDSGLTKRVDVLAKAFWPGPLTLLLPRTAAVPDAVTAGRPLVGVRIPAHPVARSLLRAAGVPVAAPSANTFGHTSPTSVAHVLADLDGLIDAVLDGGATQVGVESTVLDPATTPMVMYRPGAVTKKMIFAATSVDVRVFEAAEHKTDLPQALPSPGVGIRHYAPRARVLLAEATEQALLEAVANASGLYQGSVGVLLPMGWTLDEGKALIEPWAAWGDGDALAARLFAAMRALDDRGAALMICPLPEPGGMNDAIRDRLLKAARSH